MKLRIEGIRYENIREFRNLELDFTDSSGELTRDVSLIQMPNGTGKTTTMKLTRYALSGIKPDPEIIDSFAPKGFDGDSGEFALDLKADNESFTIRLQLDYELDEAKFRHTKPRESGGGDSPGHYLPLSLRTIITKQFVDFFVFNGELTEQFLSQDESRAEEALKTVNFLNRIEAQQNRIEKEVEERQKGKNVTTEQGLNNIQRRFKKSSTRLKQLQSNKEEIEKEIKRDREELGKLKTKKSELLDENEEQLAEYKSLSDQISKLETSLGSNVDDMVSTMRRPSNIDQNTRDDLQKLLNKMQILKLPKSTSQEFFTELANENNCICGRPIEPKHRQNINKNADRFLSEQDIGVLNSLRDNLRNISSTRNLEERFEQIDSDQIELNKKRNARATLDSDNKIQNRIDELTEKINKKENEIGDKSDILDMLTTTDNMEQESLELDWEKNIPLCKERRNKFNKQLRQATETVEFGKKAQILQDIFEEFVDRCLEHLKQAQITQTNEKLERILGLSTVQVEDIDHSIKIRNRDGVSEGQSLSIAYAYLSTLFEGSVVDVPFIIDSPAVSIDYDKREVVAEVISNLFDQLVIFVISPERERFVTELKSNDIQYLTVEKTETAGVIDKRRSEDYFMNFQSEEEDSATI